MMDSTHTYLGVCGSSRKSSYSKTFRCLGSSSVRSRDAQVLRHVGLSHVGAHACKAAQGLHSRGQSLGEARGRNRPDSDKLKSG